MYEEFFAFTRRPFAELPNTDLYFPGQAIEAARVSIERCIERAGGCGLIVGPAGTGKTLLCQVLAEQFTEQLIPVMMSNPRVTSRAELLQAISFELSLPYRNLREGELRLSLIDFLSTNHDNRNAILLIVDEAHALPRQAFEELRLLTNLVRGGVARVRLVLAGSQAVEERLGHPSLASLNQRTAARGCLSGYTSAETGQFVRAQTAAAGADPDQIWDDDALRAIHRATSGVPRLINQLCDHTLLFAAERQQTAVDESLVDHAWADFQQLPPPASAIVSNAPAAGATTVVEFSSLEDDSDPVEPTGEFASDRTTESQPTANSDVYSEGDQNPATGEHVVDADPELVAQAETLDGIENAVNEPDATFDDMPAAAVLYEDRIHSELTDPETVATEEVVLDDFAGLDAGNVVRLSPAIHSPSLTTEEYRDETTAQDDALADPTAPQDAGSLEERQFVSMSTVLDAGHEGFQQDDLEPPVVESTESVESTAAHDGNELTVGGVEDQAAGGGRASDSCPVEAVPMASVSANPLIPVRRRDYRQLFAKLRAQNEK